MYSRHHPRTAAGRPLPSPSTRYPQTDRRTHRNLGHSRHRRPDPVTEKQRSSRRIKACRRSGAEVGLEPLFDPVTAATPRTPRSRSRREDDAMRRQGADRRTSLLVRTNPGRSVAPLLPSCSVRAPNITCRGRDAEELGSRSRREEEAMPKHRRRRTTQRPIPMSRRPKGLGRIHGRLLRCGSSSMLWHRLVADALHPTASRPNATRDRFYQRLQWRYSNKTAATLGAGRWRRRAIGQGVAWAKGITVRGIRCSRCGFRCIAGEECGYATEMADRSEVAAIGLARADFRSIRSLG